MQSEMNLLLAKGIILQSGEIGQDKINLISGAMTAPLIETIWILTGYDTEAMKRVSDIFNQLYSDGSEKEFLTLLRILYDVTGLQILKEVEVLADHAKARKYFLFSFLLDMEECMQELMLNENR